MESLQLCPEGILQVLSLLPATCIEISEWSGQHFSGLMPFMASLELVSIGMGSFSDFMPIGMGLGWHNLCLLAWVRSIRRYLCCSKVARVSMCERYFKTYTMFFAFHERTASGSILWLTYAVCFTIVAQHKFGAHSQPTFFQEAVSGFENCPEVDGGWGQCWLYVRYQTGPGCRASTKPAGWLSVLLWSPTKYAS